MSQLKRIDILLRWSGEQVLTQEIEEILALDGEQEAVDSLILSIG